MKFYTVEDISKILGVHWQTVHSLIKSGQLVAIKVGKRYRVNEEDLKKYIEAHKVIINK